MRPSRRCLSVMPSDDEANSIAPRQCVPLRERKAPSRLLPFANRAPEERTTITAPATTTHGSCSVGLLSREHNGLFSRSLGGTLHVEVGTRSYWQYCCH
jgi:hypothetical protein